DAGMGLYLTGDGKGNFTPVPLVESGFFAPHNAKDMKMIQLGGGQNKQSVVLVANNQDWMQAIRCDPSVLQNSEELISLK
ncbi:MAG: hypothetical protein O6939_03785, partial [Bacteroidetes bacterium]|nr:hypothetical protein [Bacteroidota bacterium]